MRAMSRASRHNPTYLQPVVRTDIGDEDDPDTPKSKSQRKREVNALQDLGAALEALPKDKLAKVPLPEKLVDALREAKRTTAHEGKRRQMQYIGKLMRKVDPEPIREAIAAFKLGHAQDSLALHESEAWRTRLIGNDSELQAFIDKHAGVDVQQLRSLVRAARKDAALEPEKRSGRAYRELFQFIKAEAKRLHADGAEPDTEADADDE